MSVGVCENLEGGHLDPRHRVPAAAAGARETASAGEEETPSQATAAAAQNQRPQKSMNPIRCMFILNIKGYKCVLFFFLSIDS